MFLSWCLLAAPLFFVIPSEGFVKPVVSFHPRIINSPRDFLAQTESYHRNNKIPLLFAQGQDDDDDVWAKSKRINGTGLPGILLLSFALLVNVWFFTIPPNFRRARWCSAEETAANPEICMTASQFSHDIVEYYRNGGGVQWDFSVDPGIKEYYDNYGTTLPRKKGMVEWIIERMEREITLPSHQRRSSL